jgi:hypothetical protein
MAALVVDHRVAMAAVDAYAVVGAAAGAGQAVGMQQGEEPLVASPFVPSGRSGGSPSGSLPIHAGDSLHRTAEPIICQEAEHHSAS